MSGVGEDEVRAKWPLHWLVWRDDPGALDRLLQQKEHDRESHDPRGRTPLHLAVVLGRVRCADVLLKSGASALALNRHQWSVLNEATTTGNPELIGLVLQYRDQQEDRQRSRTIPLILERLRKTPDFYVEMKWEFSSWIPFVSRMCPCDTYKIWKKGTTVRVDTTLIGFHNFSWLRGDIAFIFQGTASGAHVSEINHDKKTVEEFKVISKESSPVHSLMAQEVAVLHRLNSPVVSTEVNTDTIAFQRQKSGIWGFRCDRVESVGGYEAKVFTVTGLDITTRSRVEHLPEGEKHKHKNISPLQDFLGNAQDHVAALDQAPPPEVSSPSVDPDTPLLTMEEYFTPPADPKEYDAMGRPVEVSSRTQKLKATVSLAEGFPLDLQDQILPIIDLMALNSAHFAKLKDFISLQMPAGFPVRFEIPLFHVMSAKVSFSNLNGHIQPAPHVSLHTERVQTDPTPLSTPSSSVEQGGVKRRYPSYSYEGDGEEEGEEEERTTGGAEGLPLEPRSTVEEVCSISHECFVIPPGYKRLGMNRGRALVDEEEELLQLAIQQSLMDQGGGAEQPMTLAEALKDRTILEANDPDMQRAIRSSMGMPPSQPPPSPTHPSHSHPHALSREAELEELEIALALSRQQAEEDEMRRRQQEDEELEMILRLSLEDK